MSGQAIDLPGVQISRETHAERVIAQKFVQHSDDRSACFMDHKISKKVDVGEPDR